MLIYIFPVFVQKYSFWKVWFKKPVMSVKLDLMLRILPICRIQCLYFLFLLKTVNAFFFCTDLVQELKINHLKWDLAPRVIPLLAFLWAALLLATPAEIDKSQVNLSNTLRLNHCHLNKNYLLSSSKFIPKIIFIF